MRLLLIAYILTGIAMTVWDRRYCGVRGASVASVALHAARMISMWPLVLVLSIYLSWLLKKPFKPKD